MSNPAKNFPRKISRHERLILRTAERADEEQLAEARWKDMKERVGKLRAMFYEAEKLCQGISSAVNTPELPAGLWIHADILRGTALSAMRAAQLLELELVRRGPAAPAEVKG